MTRLPSIPHRNEALVSLGWGVSSAVMVVAAVRGWGWLLAVAIVANYVADASFYRVDPRAVTWFNQREMGPAHRHLFREAVACLGWALITRPSPLTVSAALTGVLVVHGAHAAYRVIGVRNRRRRRGRVWWLGLDVGGAESGPQILPTTLPRIWTISGARFALHVDVLLVVGLWLSWTLGTTWPVWAGLAAVALGAVFVLGRGMARRRLVQRLPTPAEERAAVLVALEGLAPEVVVYFSGGPDTTYQLNVWLETIDRIEQPTVIFIRESRHLEALLPRRTPVVVLPRAKDVEAFQLPSMSVALYPTTVIKNNHMIRLRGLRHVFINHGDGDKSVTYSPLHRVFDEIWVAGEAARDRYLQRGEGVRADQLVTVGRPQLAHVEAVPEGARAAPPLTVLYAPTWEGNFEGVNYSSVAPMGELLVDALLGCDRDIRVLFKAHPATGTRLEKAATARAAIERRLATGPHEVVGTEPDALYRAFNEADVLVADISSVVADFLASRKPYLVTNPKDVPIAQFHQEFPSTAGGGVVGRDPATVLAAIEDAAGPDTLRRRRLELATYFLGAPVQDPVAHFTAEVTRAIGRSDDALAGAAAAAQVQAIETAAIEEDA
ncbi:MAG: CDP-glycerol glycerophosphotransferase family protein [Pedococcus sp.]